MAHNNLGAVLDDQDCRVEAEACYQEAIRLDPDYAQPHLNRALLWLLQGDWGRGWPEYEWRWKCKGFASRGFPQPLWDGSPLEGRTILLHAEQGLGDTLQFIRYAPLVKEQGGIVVLECQPSLLPLLRGAAGVDQWVARGSALPAFDVQVPLLSLPGILGTTPENVPGQVAYLSADAQRVEHWGRELAGGGFKVGIVWQGSRGYVGDRQRSVPLACFAPLARVEGVRLYSLQKGPGIEQLTGAGFPVTDLGSRLDVAGGAFVDTAAVMQHLDLVIAPNSALVHLAGASGRACLAGPVVAAGMALAAGPGRQPLVSEPAPLSPAAAWATGTGSSGAWRRCWPHCWIMETGTHRAGRGRAGANTLRFAVNNPRAYALRLAFFLRPRPKT